MNGLVLRPRRRLLLPWMSAVLCALAFTAPLAAQPALSTFGTMGRASVADVAVGPDGESVVTGQFFYTVDFDPGPGVVTRKSGSNNGDVFLARYRPDGTFLSVVTFAASQATAGTSVAVDASGHTVLAGRFKGALDFDPSERWAIRTSVGPDGDVFVARYAPSGDFVSVAIIAGTNGGFVVGTTGGEDLSVAVDASGHAVVAGTFSGTVDFDPASGTQAGWRTNSGPNDVFVARYAPSGAFVSVATFGGTGRILRAVTGVAVTAGGQSVVTGGYSGTVDFDPGPGTVNRTSANTSIYQGDMYVARYSPEGALISVVTPPVGSGNTIAPASADVAIDPSGHTVVTGTGGGDFDPGPGVRNASGAFVARYTATGTFVSVATVSGTLGARASGTAVAVDASGQAVMTGTFTGTVDFDPSAGKAERTGTGAFVARYTAAGAFVSVVTWGGAFSTGVAVDVTGQAVVTGYLSSAVDFDPGPGVVRRAAVGSLNVFVARYSPAGDLVSVGTFGSDGTVSSSGIAVDENDQALVVGTFSGTIDVDPGVAAMPISATSTSDVYLARYRNDGALVSVATFGGEQPTTATGLEMDASGQFVVTGTFTGTVDFDPGPGAAERTSASIYLDVFAARYDATGAVVSVVHFPNSNSGAPLVALGPSGETVLAGTFAGTVDFDPGPGVVERTSVGPRDVYVARYSAAGDLVSVVSFGSEGSTSALGTGVAVDANGNAVVVGRFSGTVDFDPGSGVASRRSNGYADVFVARYTATGDLVSVVTFGSTNSDYAHDVAVDASGNAVVTGYDQGTVDFDPGPGVVAPTGNVYVARYTAEGAFVSVAIFSSSLDPESRLALDANGQAVLTGRFTGTVDFDSGPDVVSRTSAGGHDVFVARFRADGTFVSVVTFGSSASLPDTPSDVAVDASGHSVVTGQFSSTVDFDPGAGVVRRSSTPTAWMTGSDVFVARYTAAGALAVATGTSAEETADAPGSADVRVSSVAPNPTRGAFRLVVEVGSPQRVSVGLYDVLGRRVEEVFEGALSPSAAETVAVDVSSLPVGVYVVRVEGERGVVARTLVVAR